MKRTRTAMLAVLFTAALVTTAAPEAFAITSGDVGVSSWRDECFGYWGTFKDSSVLHEKHWLDGSIECFGVAPDRTIWHTWANSGGWYEMPGNGRADNVDNVYERNGDRTVEVYVAGSSTNWCNTNPAGSVSWGSWRRC